MQCYQLFILQPDSKLDKAIIKLKEAAKFLNKVGEDIQKALNKIATINSITQNFDNITVTKPDTNGCSSDLSLDATIKISGTDKSLESNLKKILEKVKPKDDKKEPQQNNVTLECAKKYSGCLKTLLKSVKDKAKSELLQKVHEIEAQANKLLLGDYAEFREVICSTILLKASDFKSSCEKIQAMVTKFTKTCTCKSGQECKCSQCQCNGNCGDNCKCNGCTAANFKELAISIKGATDIFADIGDGLIAAFEKACQCTITDNTNTLGTAIKAFQQQVTELCEKVSELSNCDDTRPLRAKLESATIRFMAISELLHRINEYGFADTLSICSPELQSLAEQLQKEAKAFKEEADEKFKSDDKVKSAASAFNTAAEYPDKTIKTLTQDNIKCNIESFKNAIYTFYNESKSVTDKELKGYKKRKCTEPNKNELQVLKEKLGQVGNKFQEFGNKFQESINKLVGKSELGSLFKATDVAARDCESALRVLDTAYLKAANAADEIEKTIKLKASADKLVEKLWEKIYNVHKAICNKIQKVSGCNKDRINKVCEHLCSKIGSNQQSVKNCINSTCTNICNKIKALHDCFQNCIQTACTQACTKIKAACTQVCNEINKICECAKTSATQIREALDTCINLVCPDNCQCECCKTPPTDGTKQCTNAGCVCIKCTVITSANKICGGIDKFTNGLKKAVEEGCKCFCGCCDNVYNALDEVSKNVRGENVTEVNITLRCDRITASETTLDQNGNSTESHYPNLKYTDDFESIIKKIITKICIDLKKVFKCTNPQCYCAYCKHFTSIDKLIKNGCTCDKPNPKCKCIKCIILQKTKAIYDKIDNFGNQVKPPIMAACNSICTRIDTIRTNCIAACETAKSSIDGACKRDGKNICQNCTITTGCNVSCQQDCQLNNASETQCNPCDRGKQLAQASPVVTESTNEHQADTPTPQEHQTAESHSRRKRHTTNADFPGNVSAEHARALLQQPGSYTKLSRTRRSAEPQPSAPNTCSDCTSDPSDCNFNCTTTVGPASSALKTEINKHANNYAKSILCSATEYAITAAETLSEACTNATKAKNAYNAVKGNITTAGTEIKQATTAIKTAIDGLPDLTAVYNRSDTELWVCKVVQMAATICHTILT